MLVTAITAVHAHRPVWALALFVAFVFSFLPLAMYAARHRGQS